MEKQQGGARASEGPVTREDVQKILDYCGKCRTRMAMGLLVGVYGDLSLTELCVLQWKDVDLETGVIHIRQILRYEETLMDDGTKKKLPAICRELRGTITIHPDIRNLLQGWREQSEEDGFLLRDGGPCDYNSVRRRFKNMIGRAGVTAGGYKELCREFRRICEEDGLYLDRDILQMFYRMGNAGFTRAEIVSVLERMLQTGASGRHRIESETHFGELVFGWLDSVKGRLSPIAMRRYRTVCEKELLPKWKDIRLSELSQEFYDNYMAGLLADCEGDLPMWVNTVLRGILRFAAEEKYLHEMPFKTMPWSRPRGAKVRQMLPEEKEGLISYCRSAMTKPALCVLLILYEQLHLPELCALQWRDIDLDRNEIVVRYEIQTVYTEGEKNNAKSLMVRVGNGERYYPIHPDVFDILASWKSREPDDHYVLCGETYPAPSTMRIKIRQLGVSAGISDFKYRMLWKKDKI